MSLRFAPFYGEAQLLLAGVSASTGDISYQFGLFTSPTVLDDRVDLAFSDLTQPTGGGYAYKTITNTTWAAVQHDGDKAYSTATVSWTFTAATTPDTIYGWFLRSSSGVFFGAELFQEPITVEAGSKIKLNIKIQLVSEEDIDSNIPNVFPTGSESWFMGNMVGKSNPDTNYQLFLFTNDYTPVEDSVLANFTKLTTDTGLTKTWASNWGGVDGIQKPGTGTALYGATSYTLTPASYSGLVYGYLIQSATAGALVMARRFPEPVQVAVGVAWKFKPVFGLRDRNWPYPT